MNDKSYCDEDGIGTFAMNVLALAALGFTKSGKCRPLIVSIAFTPSKVYQFNSRPSEKSAVGRVVFHFGAKGHICHWPNCVEHF